MGFLAAQQAQRILKLRVEIGVDRHVNRRAGALLGIFIGQMPVKRGFAAR